MPVTVAAAVPIMAVVLAVAVVVRAVPAEQLGGHFIVHLIAGGDALLGSQGTILPAHSELVGALYRDHRGWLLAWLRRNVACPQRAEDLSQDTFVRLLGRTDLKAPREPRAFLTAIAEGEQRKAAEHHVAGLADIQQQARQESRHAGAHHQGGEGALPGPGC